MKKTETVEAVYTHTLTYLLRIKEQIKTNSISVGLYIYAYRIGLFA